MEGAFIPAHDWLAVRGLLKWRFFLRATNELCYAESTPSMELNLVSD